MSKYASTSLEKRLWHAADRFRANSGLKAQEHSSPILDPACGSGGMFVQSARFVAEHRQNPATELSICGVEKTDETGRLARLNLAELKTRIHHAQQRATLAVNRELVLLYWQIGRDILERQAREGWGAKVIERLAQDLRDAFPDMKGFSPRDLKYMRLFAEAWPDESIVQELLAQLPWYHRENLTQEELVIFDILTRPAPELYGQKCSAIFEHVYESYPERNSGVYAS